jgi:hypothetical protein
LQQRTSSKWWGIIKLLVAQISPYLSWLNLALVGVMSFYTTISPIFLSFGIVIPFWLFTIVLILVVIALAIVEWVFMMPSFYGANNRQWWEHDNPMKEKMEELEKKIDLLISESKKRDS